MSKQKIQKELQASLAHQTTIQAGAWLFTVLALIGVSEMTLEHMAAHSPAVGQHSTSVANMELFARGEGRSETARLPEEFDVGLQTPRISGL